MKPEDFKQKLRAQSLRQIPAEWRGEIVGQASRLSAVQKKESETGRMPVLLALQNFLWPHPRAWAGLAAIWIIIFALNFSMRDKTPVISEKISPPSPEMVAELKQQRLMFAQLIGVNDLQSVDRQNFLPLPRSERTEFLAA